MGAVNWIRVGAGVFVALLIIFFTHRYDSAVYTVDKAAAIAAQASADTAVCDNQKAITKGAQDALQKNLDDVAAKLVAAKRLRPASCVPVIVAGQADMAALHGKHAGQGGSGISSDWLHDYFAECRSIQVAFESCDKFTDDERAGK